MGGAWNWWAWLFCVLLIVLLIWVLPRGGRSRGAGAEERTLRERYARGEITRDEFERRMRDLHRAA